MGLGSTYTWNNIEYEHQIYFLVNNSIGKIELYWSIYLGYISGEIANIDRYAHNCNVMSWKSLKNNMSEDIRPYRAMLREPIKFAFHDPNLIPFWLPKVLFYYKD